MFSAALKCAVTVTRGVEHPLPVAFPSGDDKSLGSTAVLNTHYLRHFPQGKTSYKKIHITSVAFVKTRFSDVTELLCATPITCGISLKGKPLTRGFVLRASLLLKRGLATLRNFFAQHPLPAAFPSREKSFLATATILWKTCITVFPWGKIRVGC